MRALKKCISAVLASALVLTALPVDGFTQVQAADGAKVDATVKVLPEEASLFNAVTSDDGFGRFQGWGTSLCWWANRLGYDESAGGLVDKAADAFFSLDKGLGMNIGRYNVGGGDHVGETTDVPVNAKAQIFGVEGEGAPVYGGSKMEVSANSKIKDATYSKSDADFGITKGKKVGELKQINYVNGIGETAGTGDNLKYKVSVADGGKYTVKMLVTLDGTNKRGMAIRVNDNAASEKVVASTVVNESEIANKDNMHLYLLTFTDVDLQAGENTIAIGGKKVAETDESWALDFAKLLVVKSGEEGVIQEDEFLHPSHITRSDSAVPGYCTNVTKIDKTKPITDYAGFDRADADCGYAWNYDWDADKNQMNILKAAIKASGADFITEAFSNSPPYFMTKSGCSSGGNNAAENLREDSYHAFAVYMADVMEHWTKEGITFQSASPMNEPDPSMKYWGANSNKQEGCHFAPGTSQSKIIKALNEELKSKAAASTDAGVKAALNNIILSGTDETSIDLTISSYNALDKDTKNVIERIDTHTYGGSKRAELRALAEKEGKNLWMSEVDGAYVAGSSAGEMGAALGLAQQIMKDLNGMKASAWILWNAVDNHVDENNGADKWPFGNDYKTTAELFKKVDLTKGYWGLAFGDHNNKDLILTQKYYAFGQFSKYIRPGYSLMGTSDEANTLVAYDTQGKQAVIVAVNTAQDDKTWEFDLSRFESIGNVQAHRTSGTTAEGEKWADLTAAQVNAKTNAANRTFTATVKGNSITTFVVDNVTYDKEKSEERSKREENLKKMQMEYVSVVDFSKIDLAENKIALTESMISGSAPWNNGDTDVPKNVIDGDFGTYFDGVSNGYVQVDLGENNAKALVAYGYAPRKDYASRCSGASLYGSNDGNDWDLLHTIKSTPPEGKLSYAYVNEFASIPVMGKEYRYYKYAVGSNGTCNISELELYALPEDVTIPQPPTVLNGWVTYCEGKTTGHKYTDDTKAKYDTALAAAKNVSASATQEQKDDAMYALFEAYLGLKEIYHYDSFSGVEGAAIYDTKGDRIQAHGGQVQKIKWEDGYDFNGDGQIQADEKEFWYWIGEDKTNDYRPCPGVRAYISQDLYNWIDCGDVLKTVPNWETFTTDSYFTSLYGDLSKEQQEAVYGDLWTDDNSDNSGCVLERPKMIYNDKNQEYVIWFHADGQTPNSTGGNYAKAKAGVATSKSPFGPFKLQGSYLLNYDEDITDRGFDTEGGHVRDMNLFKDDDGTGYVLYSSDGNENMYIAKLNEDYTNIVKTNDEGAKKGEDFTVNFVGQSREAPAMFKYQNKYYLITSGCTGWTSNPSKYAVADHPMGPWTMVGDPCTDEDKDHTYFTQSTCVIPLDAETGRFIYMGDRWYNSNDSNGVTAGPGAGGRLRDSRYVWLPIEFTGDGKIAIRRYSDWKLTVFDGIEPYELKTELPEAGSAANLSTELPAKLKIKLLTEAQEREVDVTWNTEEIAAKTLGEVTVTGAMTYTKSGETHTRTITHNMSLLDEKLIYFFDCASDQTGAASYFDLLRANLEGLKNVDPDQAYSVENLAGYDGNRGDAGTSSDDSSYDFAIKSDAGEDMWTQGYWATKGKSIKYSFVLEAGTYTVATGYHEWWNSSRAMNITVTSNGETLASSEEFGAKKNVNLQQNVAFTLAENAKVTVSISGNGADPVLSWMAMIQDVKTGSFESADTEELGKLIGNAEKIEKGDNTTKSWNKFQEALSHAKEVQKYVLSTATDIAAAMAELKDAMDSLQTPKQYLQASLAELAISDTNQVNYEKDAMWDYYQQVLKDVNALVDKEGLTEEEAEAAIKDLRDTIELLTPAKNKPATPPSTTQKKAQAITVKSVTKSLGTKAFALGAKTSGDGALSYRSSDSKVASVDAKGKVTLKGVGVCTITVTAAETANYKSATASVKVTVNPKKAAISKVKTVKGKKLKVSWKKDTTVSGYEIQCALKKNFKSGLKKTTIKKAKTTSTTIKKLKKGKKYYVRVRAYKTVKVNGKNVTLRGSWSSVKTSGKVK